MTGLALLVVALPLVSALLVAVSGESRSQRAGRISVAVSTLTLLGAVGLLWSVLSQPGGRELALGNGWAILTLDPLSALMSVLIAGISLLVHLYSRRYMAEEVGYARFFLLLDLMTAALLLMVAAGDMLSLILAWHLVGVLLYLLLGQDTRSHASWRYGFWTLITYRFGDLPIVLAALLLYEAFGTWSLSGIFAGIAANPDLRVVFDIALVDLVGGLLALAAFARSAQFLLHSWLPYTMAGPTPVSALMHAGIVNAGGFLINRFAPVLVHSGTVLHWLFLVGLITAVIGSVLMLAQNDIKKSLGYSTMGQMGFMVMETGVGAFSLAVFHLIAHGLFKGTLFLGAGGVIQGARRDDGVPKDPLYTFVVERRSARQRQPWLVMALVTLIVPVIILVLAHWLVEQNHFQKQGALVLLFFGWVTGAQLIFTTYRMRTENLLRLAALMLFSFTVVVLGYILISHAFDLFLYPDPQFRSGIYIAASIDLIWFDLLMVLVMLVVIGGWVLTYYNEQSKGRHAERVGRLRLIVYALISREFAVGELYAWLSERVLSGAARLNLWLRWS